MTFLAVGAPPLVEELAIVVAATAFFGYLAQRLGLVAIVGYLVAGVAIGPEALGLIDDIELVEQMAEIGVIFLMFFIGLELSGESLRKMGSLMFGGGALQVGLTIVGPEAPLADGLTDAFQAEKLRVFGPNKAAAQLEGSKVFCKNLLHNADVPSADFRVFRDPDSAARSSVRCPFSSLRSPITTLAPSSRKRMALARPIPFAPPVITATLP